MHASFLDSPATQPDRVSMYMQSSTAAAWPNISRTPPGAGRPPPDGDIMSTPSSIRLATSLLRIATSIFLLISFHVILSGWGAHGVAVGVRNRCAFPIWPAVAPNEGHPVLANGGFFLPPGQTKRLFMPSTWSGRLWARTGCGFRDPRRRRPCKTGDCLSRLACNGTTGEPPATLVEMTLHSSGQISYGVSVVDGYNLPVSFSTLPDNKEECFTGGCIGDPNLTCPPELQVTDGRRGEVVACKSACLAFDLDRYCCRNEYGREDVCGPNDYSRMLKKACPEYRSYAFDGPRRDLVRCSARAYIITFCPPMAGTSDARHAKTSSS